ncbi:MAG: cyclic nucleotide-binding domain-containing protein [Thermodesulfobacteriota bacterium]
MTENDAGLASDALIARLKTISPLDRFADGELRSILGMSRILQYDRNDAIIRENEYDNRVYFLIAGEVQVEKGGRQVKRIRETGAVFGEMGVIEGAARSATVTAVKKTVCLALDASLAEELRAHGGGNILERIFLEALADRLRATTDELAAIREEMLALRRQRDSLRTSLASLEVLLGRAGEILAGARETRPVQKDAARER